MKHITLLVAFCSVLVGAFSQELGAVPNPAAGSEDVTFATPEEASSALGMALKDGNLKELRRILGVPASETIMSGDNVADLNSIHSFYTSYRQKNVWEKSEDNRVATLYVGPQEAPLAFPLVKNPTGWSFDYEAGKEELNDRRVGRNELFAISVCREYVEAQSKYYELDPDGDGHKEYAQLAISSPGYRNGLFYARAPGERPSPLGVLVAKALAEGYAVKRDGSPTPIHGYYFKILKEQGAAAEGGKRNYITSGGRMTEGFALLAYPARWGYSGIMSFMVAKDGAVYEKNLGSKSAEIGGGITSYNPDTGWQKVSLENSGEVLTFDEE